jgi:hypothetical protein
MGFFDFFRKKEKEGNNQDVSSTILPATTIAGHDNGTENNSAGSHGSFMGDGSASSTDAGSGGGDGGGGGGE